jgi:regulator of protease activity HflC (stomatin/prohibitin superfamily)
MLGINHIVIAETEVGLLYRDGRFARPLAPGRHRVLGWPWGRESATRVDVRRTPFVLSGQEMLTADALSVRLNVAAEFRVIDAPRALHTVQDYKIALYQAVQILLRDEVQARTLDALLADRSALAGSLLARGRPEAEALGLELTRVGVRDIILPGDVKRMLSQEIEAQRAGRAALVAAREETAATRAKANTAQILAGNPVLLRLREIEALGQVAGGMGNTVVVAVPGEILTALGAAARTSPNSADAEA